MVRKSIGLVSAGPDLAAAESVVVLELVDIPELLLVARFVVNNEFVPGAVSCF